MRADEFICKNQDLDEGLMDFAKRTADKLLAAAWPSSEAVPMPKWDPYDYMGREIKKQYPKPIQKKPEGMSDKQYDLIYKDDPAPGKFGYDLTTKDLEERIRILTAKKEIEQRIKKIAWESKTPIEKIQNTVVGITLRVVLIWLGVGNIPPGGRIDLSDKKIRSKVLAGIGMGLVKILGAVVLAVANKYLGGLAEQNKNK